MLRAISVGEGPVEDLPDVCHVVHTDSKALEHGTAKGKQGQSGQAEAVRGGENTSWTHSDKEDYSACREQSLEHRAQRQTQNRQR